MQPYNPITTLITLTALSFSLGESSHPVIASAPNLTTTAQAPPTPPAPTEAAVR